MISENYEKYGKEAKRGTKCGIVLTFPFFCGILFFVSLK